MDWEITLKGLGLILCGLLFVAFGMDGWQNRRHERINLVEAAILKAGKDDKPLPLNRWDRTMSYVQPVLMLIFGPLMILGGVAVLLRLGE